MKEFILSCFFSLLTDQSSYTANALLLCNIRCLVPIFFACQYVQGSNHPPPPDPAPTNLSLRLTHDDFTVVIYLLSV